MMKEMSLLDKMAKQTDCAYLSNLHYIDDSRRLHLAEALKNFPAEGASLSDWNDALKYCTGETELYSNP